MNDHLNLNPKEPATEAPSQLASPRLLTENERAGVLLIAVVSGATTLGFLIGWGWCCLLVCVVSMAGLARDSYLKQQT